MRKKDKTKIEAKECPKCGLFNPHTAQLCDCGYKFKMDFAQDNLVNEIHFETREKTSKKESHMANQKTGKELKTKKCSHCNKSIYYYAFKCDFCGSWVDHDTFHRLTESDIELIKSNDLVVATPSLFALMCAEQIKWSLEEMLKNLDEKRLNFDEAIFCSYGYASVLDWKVKKKKGKENILSRQLRVKFIWVAYSVFRDRVQDVMYNPDEVVTHGLDIYSKLDEVLRESSEEYGKVINPESRTAIKMGDVIYGEDNSLIKTLNLAVLFGASLRLSPSVTSKYFLVEEDDYDWRSMIG